MSKFESTLLKDLRHTNTTVVISLSGVDSVASGSIAIRSFDYLDFYTFQVFQYTQKGRLDFYALNPGSLPENGKIDWAKQNLVGITQW
ncbi:MAG: hypothetical protein IPJ84_03250 [Bdellovibrionales bacterium]|nr:hypothetical protein [Bdellovibrionales bacterium]